MRAHGALAVVLGMALASSGPAFAADSFAQPVPGFVARDAFDFPSGGVGVGGLATQGDGTIALYVNGALEVEGPQGPRVLARFDPPVFGSFVVVSPDGRSLVFGESTEWNIYRVPLDGGEPVILDNLRFAFDLVFDAKGRGLVSALRNNPENEIVLLDDSPEGANRAVITDIPGVSGPLALDSDGNLYYGTVVFSDQVSRQSLHRFTRDQVEAAITGDPLSFESGETLLEDMDGFYDLAWHEGKLYFTELGFQTGVGTVQVIDPARNYLVSTLAAFPEETGILSPTWLAFRDGGLAFEAGNGSAGGSLVVAYSDYASVLRVAEITPQLYFVRGETNGDGGVDLSDAIALLAYLFLGGTPPPALEAADANADGEVDVSDAVYVLDYLFGGGPIIPPPFPEPGPAP